MRLAGLVVVLGLLFGPAVRSAWGQDEVTRIRAQAHIDAARAYFRSQDYGAAMKELQQAQALIPLPINVFNIARCLDELDNLEQALARFEEYLALPGDKPEEDRARKAVVRLVRALFGVVHVTCRPKGARVKLEGRDETACPRTLRRVPPGTWRLGVAAPGHASHSELVRVEAGSKTEVRVRLKVLPARLHLRSEAGAGKLYVDGDPAGELPAGPVTLAPGRRRLRVETPEHALWTLDVVLAPGEEVRVTAVPSPGPGSLSVRSTPAGATVRIDGEAAGVTPLAREGVPPGERLVAVSLDGYRQWRGPIWVYAGEKSKVETTLTPLPGLLEVVSEPPGAEVSVDGVPTGVTPLDNLEVRAGSHRVELRSEGHRTFSADVEATAERRVTMHVRLKRRTAKLDVFTDPPGATVRLEGEELGTTPLWGTTVPTGRLALKLDRALYASWGTVPPDGHPAVTATLPSRRLVWGVMATATAALAASAISFALSEVALDDMDSAAARYHSAQLPTEVAAWRGEVESETDRAARWRLVAAGAGGTAAVLGLVGTYLLLGADAASGTIDPDGGGS